MTKARQKGVRKVNEMKIKVHETSGDHQGYIEWIKKFDFGNLLTENLHGITHGNVSDVLRKRLGMDFLHGNDFFH